MKKSKVIVPSLGILLLSAAASISGTVAWFTANRTFELDAGNFAVISTKTNLECEVTAGVGTKVNASTGAIELDVPENYEHLELTDASVDVFTNNGRLVAPEYSGKKVGKVVTLASANDGYNEEYDPDGDSTPNPGYDPEFANGLYRETYTSVDDEDNEEEHLVFSAFTWTMDFTVAYGGSGGQKQALYLDLNATDGSTATLENGSAPTDTGKGFRVAFIPVDVDDTAEGVENGTGIEKVWAPNRELSHEEIDDKGTAETDDDETIDVTDIKYCDLSGSPTSSTTLASLEHEYDPAKNTLIDSTCVLGLPEDGEGTEDAVNYLGTFDLTPSSTVHLKYLVVVYYEGTDPDIVNTASTVYETIVTHFVFGTAELA